MPTEKDFKRLVRQRMVETGERYTAARAALERRHPSSPPVGARVHRGLELLASVDHAVATFELLKTLPVAELRPIALAGLDHESWRVRRSCCQLLDDLAVTEESLAALTRCLDDPHPRVRRAAVHTLSCERCKPDGCTLDVRGTFERMANDPSHHVRTMVANTLSWSDHGPWAVDLLRRFAASDPSTQIRAVARQGLEYRDLQVETDRRRRALPPTVRAQTDRHPGKWVAVADGRVVTAARFPGTVRRALRGMRRPDAETFWVDAAPA